MKWVKKIVFLVLVSLVGIQFFPTKRNQNTAILTADFTKTFDVPTNIQSILKTSCYDCHSNNTNYPWYNKTQPISWFMEHHIKKGKAELNFSEFGMYSKRKQKNKLKAIVNQIKEGEMPLSSYTFIHSNAKLTEQQKKEIMNWINTLLR
ncbi:MAG: heme-binding domain-containing protein [Bacteroidetes bacterium]|nr:heme-binding domain-containing protein [Bacteroidota bacterium]